LLSDPDGAEPGEGGGGAASPGRDSQSLARSPSACRLQDPVARKLCVLPCHGRGARRTRMYEANATATESTAKTSSTSKSLAPIEQRGDLQLGTAFTVSSLLTYAFMHASCLIKIQIERIVLDEIVANTVWW